MLRPSTAPRWKMAMSVLRRPLGATDSPCAKAVRFKNDGALPTSPTLASATLLCFRNSLRFITSSLFNSTQENLLPLELRRADDERGDARHFGVADRAGGLRLLAPRGGGVLLAGRRVGRRGYRRAGLVGQLLRQYFAALRRDVALQDHFEEAVNDRLLVYGAAARGLVADEAREVNAHARNAVRDEREREVQAFQERAGVDPVVGRVRVAGRRDVAVERL